MRERRQEGGRKEEGRKAGRTKGWGQAGKQKARRQGNRDEEGLKVPI